MKRALGGQHTVNTGSTHAKLLSDLGRSKSLGLEPEYISLFGSRRRLAALKLAFRLRLSDPHALPLKHKLALELGDAAKDRQHEAARGRIGVDTEVEDAKGRALAVELVNDCEQMRHRARQPVELGDDEAISLACELRRLRS